MLQAPARRAARGPMHNFCNPFKAIRSEQVPSVPLRLRTISASIPKQYDQQFPQLRTQSARKPCDPTKSKASHGNSQQLLQASASVSYPKKGKTSHCNPNNCCKHCNPSNKFPRTEIIAFRHRNPIMCKHCNPKNCAHNLKESNAIPPSQKHPIETPNNFCQHLQAYLIPRRERTSHCNPHNCCKHCNPKKCGHHVKA